MVLIFYFGKLYYLFSDDAIEALNGWTEMSNVRETVRFFVYLKIKYKN